MKRVAHLGKSWRPHPRKTRLRPNFLIRELRTGERSKRPRIRGRAADPREQPEEPI